MKYSVEQIFIGELINNGEKITEVKTVIPDGTIFREKKCADFYEAILDTYDLHGKVDYILVDEALKIRKLDLSLLMEWGNQSYTSAYILDHAKQIAEIYIKKISSEAIRSLHDEFTNTLEPFDAIDQTINTLSHLRSQFRKNHAVSMSIIAGETLEEVDKIQRGENTSLPFGLVDIDNVTGGMENGDLVIIAGLEKRGKSTLMLQTLFHNTLKGTPCLLLSTEMTRKQVMFRYAFIAEKLSWIHFKQHKLSSLEWERLRKQIVRLGSLPFYIRDGVLTIADILAESERFVNERKVKLIAVDYIQRVVPINKKSNENREREIASISSGLKNIAIDLKIPVIALSQLNEDLRARESRSIEQDMDKMIIINSEDKDEETADRSGSIVGVKIRQRMGVSGNFGETKLFYDKGTGSWRSYLNADERTEPAQTAF